MNPRIVELLANPQILVADDLDLIQSEIASKPYLQNLRAVYLLGIHQFQPENYNQVLSETAAFTTDKKILYQLINGKYEPEIVVQNVPFEEPKEEFIQQETQNNIELVPQEIEKESFSDKSLEIIQKVEKSENKTVSYEDVQPLEKLIPKEIFVKGELNRILFEGEENFLDEETPKIDLEQTQESGKIVVEKKIETPESQIKTSEQAAEPVEMLGEKEINFHQTTHFLPDVKIAAKKEETFFKEPQKISTNKHEEEMQKLIAEVERKMKEKKSDKKEEVFEGKSGNQQEVSFAETQEFNIKDEVEVHENVKEEKVEKNEEKPQVSNHWKPLDFQQNLPDSSIKSQEIKVAETPKEEIEKTEEKQTSTEEVPVMSVSFFSEKIETISKKEEQKLENTEPESNVPTFINTWQNWLKIERKEEKKETDVPEETSVPIEKVPEITKSKVIETFIETEPKISRLKEESDYVVKEKGKDISHLMTETLANIYAEQKLYSKAIKAFEALKKKHPEKEEYFENRIQEIKEQRSN